MTIVQTKESIYHVFTTERDCAMLYRYHIFPTDHALPADEKCRETAPDVITLSADKRIVTLKIEPRHNGGYRILIPLIEKERLFGLGDATRDRVMVRGAKTDMFIENVSAYGPMPVLLSDEGWAFVLNSTYHNAFDCAATDPNVVVIESFGGTPDFYLFRGESLKELLAKITQITGRPMMLPKFAYGLTFVQNEETDARSLLWDIRTMRDKNIPCDVMGLEPAWMEKYYDYSVDKEWSHARFPLPYWHPKNTSDTATFFFPMREMGMQLSLWLCNDYDLFFEEERQYAQEAAQQEKDGKKRHESDAVIADANLQSAEYMDKLTQPNEPWFRHLQKFVDNGAAAFKLDGSLQVVQHPDRLWAGKYLDLEAHNIYPVLLAKQIANGFRDYTDRRLLLYSSAAYLGTQQFAATWAGDTGGGPRTLVSMMNYAMCGHANTACDISVTEPCAIHYGFLTPWSQYFCWANWTYPWFLRREIEDMIRFYANLRSSLFPYLYTMAHKAYETGLPILRPLPLVCENTDRFDEVTNEYMLGDCLLVGAFDMNLTLPEGKWVDYFTDEVYEGDIHYKIPEGKGGALFVKEGSIFVTMEPQKYILEKLHDLIIQVFPGADYSFDYYEDDGFTFDYQDGKYAITHISMRDTNENGYVIQIGPRKGGFRGRPENGHDIKRNSIPEILPMQPVRDMTVQLHAHHGRLPSAVEMNGEPLPVTAENGTVKLTVPAAALQASVVTIRVEA